MKENFPNLVKGLDIEVQEAQRVPNEMDTKRTTPRHIIIRMPKFKEKERILKAEREKHLITYRGAPIRLSADFIAQQKPQARKKLAPSIQNDKKQRPTTKTTLSSKAII